MLDDDERREAKAVNEVSWVLREFDPASARRILRAAAVKLGWEPDVIVTPDVPSTQ
jgi:hypothetical protein